MHPAEPPEVDRGRGEQRGRILHDLAGDRAVQPQRLHLLAGEARLDERLDVRAAQPSLHADLHVREEPAQAQIGHVRARRSQQTRRLADRE